MKSSYMTNAVLMHHSGTRGVIITLPLREICDKIIVDKNDTATTVGEFRRRIKELDTLRLNRKKANRALARLDLEDPTIEQQFVVIG